VFQKLHEKFQGKDAVVESVPVEEITKETTSTTK
jgi:hypothetical protein